MYAEDQNRDLLNDEGEPVPTWINEATTLKATVDSSNGQTPTGLWIGGNKYKITKKEDDVEAGDSKITMIQGTCKIEGQDVPNAIAIGVTPTSVIVAIGVSDGRAGPINDIKQDVADFAAYMISEGL